MKPIQIYQKAVGVDVAPLPLPVAVPIRPGKSVIIPFRPKEPEPSEENVKREKRQTAARSAVKKKKYEVASVEISYNGDGGKFNQFLAAVMANKKGGARDKKEKKCSSGCFRFHRNDLRHIFHFSK